MNEVETTSELREMACTMQTTTGTATKFEESNVSWLNTQLYRPLSASRSLIIHRGNAAGQTVVVDRSSHRYSLDVLDGDDEVDNVVPDIQLSAGEKKQMRELNARFAEYIENVRFLSAQNRRLEEELSRLRSKWGTETQLVKAEYETRLAEAMRLYEKSVDENAKVVVQLSTADETVEELRRRYDEIHRAWLAERTRSEQLTEANARINSEMAMLRFQVQCYATDHGRDTKLIQELKEQLRAIRTDLDNQTIQFVHAETSKHSLEEELKFVTIVHEQEMKELSALSKHDWTTENREFWKTEMSLALREIQKAYDYQIEVIRVEYERKLQKIIASRSDTEVARYVIEIKRLKEKLNSLYEKISQMDTRNATLVHQVEVLHVEKQDIERHWTEHYKQLDADFKKLQIYVDKTKWIIQQIRDAKVDLKSEISSYRTLLKELEDGERWYGKIGGDSSSIWHSSASTEGKDEPHDHSEFSTKIFRSGAGPVVITETSSEGKFVQLSNTGHKDEDLSGWFLQTSVDGKDKISFKLPDGFVMKPEDKRKIWAKGAKPGDERPDDPEMDQDSWGSGEDVTTKLVNRSNEASYVLKRTTSGSKSRFDRQLIIGSTPIFDSDRQAVEISEERRDKLTSEDEQVDQSQDQQPRESTRELTGESFYQLSEKGPSALDETLEEVTGEKLTPDDEQEEHGEDQQPQVSTGEFTRKTVFQRSAKGPTAIAETSPEGKFVELENTRRKEEDLSGWCLKTDVDGNDKVSFKLPENFVMKPRDKIKIWAKGAKPADAGPGDLELDQDSWPSWASGTEVTTKLVNPANEDRATHTKKIK